MDNIFKGSDYNEVKSSSRAGRGDVFIAYVGSIPIGDESDVSYNERHSQEHDEMRRMCEFSTVHAASCRRHCVRLRCMNGHFARSIGRKYGNRHN